MKSIVLSLLILCSLFIGRTQELNCQVNIITDARMELTSVEKEVIDQLKQTIYELMNNTQWTKEKFKVEERINCNLQIQINSIPTPGTFSGAMQVQSTRPAFNSSYNTTVLNFNDQNVEFSFARNTVLVYAPNQFRDNLTSMLAFYAYFIIGMDFDSFSLNGGTPYFSEAQQIVSNAQAASYTGWKSNEAGKRNRFYLVDNVLQAMFEPLRLCFYDYHRKGIDKLYENRIEARKTIYESLLKLDKVITVRPNALNIVTFIQGKTNELKGLYDDAPLEEKDKIVNLLMKLDPTNSTRYQEIKG
jgi:hypothetical protein